jgi:type II secretory pathway component PulF
VTTAALVGLLLVLWLGLYLELLRVVPGFEQTFADFRLRLPVAMEVPIAASRWVNRYWYVPVLFELMVAPVIAAVSYLVRHRVRSR